jgi:hypothetical protein
VSIAELIATITADINQSFIDAKPQRTRNMLPVPKFTQNEGLLGEAIP